MKALVTGGGGFLGSAIIRMLRERDRELELVSLSRSRHAHLDDLDVVQISADIADERAVEAAAEGCDVVFHVAARASNWGEWDTFYTINVAGTENVINACLAANVPNLVYTSSPSVVFDGTDLEGVDESTPQPEEYIAHYPHTKALAERRVLASSSEKLGTVALRPHLIWGPGDTNLVPRVIQRGRAGKLRRIGKKKKLIDTVYIDDAARAHLLAFDRLRDPETHDQVSGKVYFITSGQTIDTWEMINRILAAADLPPVDKSVPFALAFAAGWVTEKVWAISKRQEEPMMTRWVAQNLSHAHWFDISAARRDLGYEPQVTIDEGLERLARWLKDNPIP